MTGILGKFQVEHGVHGTRVLARSNQLTSFCAADAEIDTAIQMLKDDLDACAREMKRLERGQLARRIVRRMGDGHFSRPESLHSRPRCNCAATHLLT